MSDAPILEPGDIFFTRGRGTLSKLIRVFTRRIGESRTRVNHVGIVTLGGRLNDVKVVEALSKVEFHPLLKRYGRGSKHDVAVFRPTDLSREQIDDIVDKAEKYVGYEYGWGKIAAHFADWLLQGAYVFRRLTRDDRYPICSWVVAHAFGAAGKHFGTPPGAASPDDIWDFVTRNPDKYREVIPLGPLEGHL